jgi:uncharacterized protein YlzI (FlbEa/FlbD family)
MAGLREMKIRKKTYQFEVRKKYAYAGHYRIRERPPIERIRSAVAKLLAPKKAAERAETAQAAPGGFNFVVFGAAVLVAVIILTLGWLYITVQSGSQGLFHPQLQTPSIDNVILGGDILTAGSRGSAEHVAAVMVDYNTANIINYTVNITTYDAKIPSQVFVLESDKSEATTYADFIRTLRAELSRKQITLNEISIRQLETLPDGAMILVPSGIVPEELLGIGSSLDMDSFASRGMVVIYIGQPFTNMLNGTLAVQTPQNVAEKLPVSFDESETLVPSGGFNLFQPLYRATGNGAGWQSTTAYDAVSVLTKGNGAFLFVPQTLDGGWRDNYTAAADDIARIIYETPWAQPNAPSKVYNLANQTNYSGTSYFFSGPFQGKSSTIRMEFSGYPTTSFNPVQQTLYTWVQKKPLGELYIDDVNVVSTNITNERVRLNAHLVEPVAAQPNMFISIVDANGTEVQSLPQGNVNVQADSSFDMPAYVDRGEYTVKLMDEAGKVYAQTYMNVVSLDITFAGSLTSQRSVYIFDVTMAGNPVQLNSVHVVVDGGRYGSYDFNSVSNIVIDVGNFTGGDSLPMGDHAFEFTAGGLQVTVPVAFTRTQTIFDNPLLWIVIVLTGGIVGIGIFFARQEGIAYFVDIPDFPPVARTRIPLSTDTVLAVLAKVDENYRWQNTPLTPSEIKNGFKDIFYKGKPVYVTDYNVEYLLNELEKRRMVKESMGYYGLVQWEEASKRSINYLAMMRSLRDICVNNAVPFTALGESENADSEVTVAGQQMFLHFYEKEDDQKELLKRALGSVGKGITIILFRNEADKGQFQDLMHSPSVAPLLLKMEAESGAVQLLTADEFEKMLIEFKSM